MSENTNKKPVVKIIIVAVILIGAVLGVMSYKDKERARKYSVLSEESHKVWQMAQDTKNRLETATGEKKAKLEAELKQMEALHLELEKRSEKYRP